MCKTCQLPTLYPLLPISKRGIDLFVCFYFLPHLQAQVHRVMVQCVTNGFDLVIVLSGNQSRVCESCIIGSNHVYDGNQGINLINHKKIKAVSFYKK